MHFFTITMQIFDDDIQRQSACGISIFGGTQNSTGHGPEKPDVALKLALHWAGLDHVNSSGCLLPELF